MIIMQRKKELIINFIATFLAFFVNALINFFLSSYIVNTVSEEAYGFVQFANTFVTYFTVITLAINSMASRFISIEYYKDNIKEAEEYYSATFWSNIAVMIISVPILLVFILNIQCFVNISSELVTDVQWLFAFLAGNLLLGLLTTNLSVSYYIKNKLYIQSLINMISYILKAVILYVLYLMFPPYVAFFGLATLIATTFIQGVSLYYKRKLIPDIRIGKFNFSKAKTLLTSGIWNSITRVGNILSEGLDLFITNLFLDASSMGILAIVKIIPNIIGSVLNNLINIFMPSMVRVYAQESKENFVKLVKQAMSFVGIFLNIPIICIIVFGDILFQNWFPTQNATLLQILSIISISQWIIIGPVSIMHNIFTVINKIKVNSILICITGVINIGVVYLLLKFTNLGIYAVVGVSCMLSIIRNLFYTLPFGAKYIGYKWWVFFPEIGRSILSVIINTLLGFGLKILIDPQGWISLILTGISLCLIILIINCVVMFTTDEKKKIWNYLKYKVKEKRIYG